MKDTSPTKLCKHCKSEMKKGAKVCPTCGKRQRISLGCLIPLIIVGAVFLFIVLFISACNKGVDEVIKEDKQKKEDKKVSVEEVVYDNDGIKITYMGMEAATLNVSTNIKFKIENSTDKSLTISTDDFSVDGYSINATMYAEVPAGKIANDSIGVLDSYLKDNGLSYDSIKEAEFKIRITDSDHILKSEKSDVIKVKLR
ncbi:MAG: hypothetical protein IKS13_09305 [Ruminococcus sp.]|nr:hypothetical protein [Ruminococcus sp.]